MSERIELYRTLLHYNPDTGELVWRERAVSHFRNTSGRTAAHAQTQWNQRYAGKPAGNKKRRPEEYRRSQPEAVVFSLSGKSIKAHRAIWEMMTGVELPDGIVPDHRDGDPWNNKWSNLRLATHSQNQCNRALQQNNTSGFSGVRWLARLGKWNARIVIRGREIYLGLHETKGMAAVARAKATLRYHGQFSRLWM